MHVAPDTKLPEIRITNKEVSLACFNAIWDEDHSQLVALGLASTELQGLKSILATLATNSKRNLTLRMPYPHYSIYLENARKGFFKLGRTMESVNAKGYSLSIEHPACHDPRGSKFPYFYVVSRSCTDDFRQKFIDRLNTATIWPIKMEYADYLLEQGEDTGLIKTLPICGPGYDRAIVVLKNDPGWEALLSAGVIGGHISINTN
jgi:hypothetical protein